MNKTELITSFAKATGFSKKQTSELLDTLLNLIVSTLAQKDEIKIIGFGTFKVSRINAKTVINPHNKKEMKVPACNRVRFVPGKSLKDAVN